jgi:hypothetical protein
MKLTKDQIRDLAEADLETFIRLVHPQRMLGNIHKDVISWWNREGAKSHQLLLLPRDHMKSALVAYRVAHAITKDPTVRVLYISATSGLAVKQLKFIKDILTSDIYTYYWPEMVHREETRREKWTETEISVDHPKRAAEAVRDPTVFTAGLTTNIVGMHSDISVFDDVVVPDNAYTEEGRGRVLQQYGYLASIEGADSQQWVVGTRYHPQDLYNHMRNIQIEMFDESGALLKAEEMYEIFERQVENRGDGAGEFLWPRQQRADGKWFGFNQEILARKKAQYDNKSHFFAQYYNNPNDSSESPIDPSLFQYYDKGYLQQRDGYWTIYGRRLNVVAAVDFAYTYGKRSDSSSVVVVGTDGDNNHYILEIARFKTQKISEYFENILRLHTKWGFRKIRAEVTAAQSVIVRDLKDNYIRPLGLALAVDEYKPTSRTGSKAERMAATLYPRYENRQIWHYKDGNCQILEEELTLANPPHDDVKDALTAAIDVSVAPTTGRIVGLPNKGAALRAAMSHNRYGGFL